MPIFGQHETGPRIHLSGVGSVYLLKRDEKKILKVVQPPEGIWTDDQTREEIEAFVLRAKIQRNLARTSDAWARIDEIAAIRPGTEGSSGGGEATSASRAENARAAANAGYYQASGAFLVMDRYDRSVQSLINGRVNVTNDDLRNLMTGILKGLRDIRQSASRPHGSLAPSNILLANSADLARATVHNSDPAAAGSLTSKSDNQDFTDLAHILYELVNLRPYQGGTVPKTREWDRLGPNGEDWRKLCNTFLDIGGGGGTAEDRDFDRLLAKIDTWRAKPKTNKLPLIAAAAALILILGAVGIYFFAFQERRLDFSQSDWERLCLEYNSWFKDLADNRKKINDRYPPEFRKLMASDKIDDYDPRAIALKDPGFKNLAAAPTENARTGRRPNATRHALEYIDKVRESLAPAKWPALDALNKKADEYQKRGWEKPAAGIRSLVQSARPPQLSSAPDVATRFEKTPTVNMIARIDETLRAADSINQIDKSWLAIEDLLKTLPKTDIPLLNDAPRFAEEFPRSKAENPTDGTLADVVALNTSFTEIQKILTQLSTDLNRKDPPVLLDELAKDEEVKNLRKDPLTIDMYARLMEIAKGYVKLQKDPRTDTNWTAALQDVQKSFIDPIKEQAPEDPHLADLAKRKQDIEATVAAFSKLPPIQLQQKRIAALVTTATADLEKLRTDGEVWVAPYIIDPPAYIARQRALLDSGPLTKATPVVRDQWKKAHEELLKKIEAVPQELKKYRTFKAVDAKFTALQNVYTDFDQKIIPANVPGLSNQATTTAPGGPPRIEAWKAAIADRVATIYRERALTDLMTSAALKWSDDLPQTSDPAYQSYLKNRVASFEQTRLDTLALLNDFSTIEGRLNHLDLQPNEPTKNAKSWRDLLGKWTDSKNPLLADPQIVAALKPITDRTTALLALDNVSDYKALAADALSTAPEIALAAWRKLGSAQLAESLPVLDDEEKAQSHLTTLLSNLTKANTVTTDRASAITTEMKSQEPLRWHRYVSVLTSADAIQSALDRRPAFNVTLAATTYPALAYDDLLYNLRKSFDKNPKDAELKALARRFITDVQALPATASKDKSVLDLLAKMQKPLAPNAEELSTAGAGPKLAGWEEERPSPDVRLFYYPARSNARSVLEFTRITANQKTVFLCTSEVSFAIFAQAVSAPQRIRELDYTGKPEAQQHWFKRTTDPWAGPRVWKFNGSQFSLNDEWLAPDPQLQTTPLYPTNATPEKPNASFPMQYISPWAAVYVARALGCRLPTSDEFAAAIKKFEIDAPQQATKDPWNLRGAAWLAQKQFDGKLAAKGGQYPDSGIYLTADFLYDPSVKAENAKPWDCTDLAKILPNRVASAGVYPTSQIWFRKVASQPGVPALGSGIPHDLIGNVAEYVFDAPSANAVIKDANPKTDAINATMAAEAKNLFVIGGSSLSPPQIPLLQKQPVLEGTADTGFADVGFRLAYTAPIDSITDVLAAAFKSPPYLAPK
jgi:hypothetical protein